MRQGDEGRRGTDEDEKIEIADVFYGTSRNRVLGLLVSLYTWGNTADLSVCCDANFLMPFDLGPNRQWYYSTYSTGVQQSVDWTLWGCGHWWTLMNCLTTFCIHICMCVN